MLDQSNELAAWDRDHFFHPSTHMGTHARGESPTRVMAGGEGVTVWDVDGRKSIDAFAGLYCVNVGYGRQKIADVIAAQAKNLGKVVDKVTISTEKDVVRFKAQLGTDEVNLLISALDGRGVTAQDSPPATPGSAAGTGP